MNMNNLQFDLVRNNKFLLTPKASKQLKFLCDNPTPHLWPPSFRTHSCQFPMTHWWHWAPWHPLCSSRGPHSLPPGLGVIRTSLRRRLKPSN